MTKKLLITGASGFLGYHLIEAALARGYEVFAGVRSSSNTEHLASKKIQLVSLNLSDIEATRKMLQLHDIGYIIHAAAQTRAKDEAAYNLQNALLTKNLAMAAADPAVDLKKFVFISSLASRGPSVDGLPINESTRPQPVTWYGKSKLLAETYLSEIARLPYIVLRPTAVYGPREKDLLLVVKSVFRGIEVYIGNKGQRLSFIYVKDVAEATMASLESVLERECFNLSDGRVYDRYAFANAVKKAGRKKSIRIQLPLGLVQMVAAGMDRLYKYSSKTPVLNLDRVKELTAEDWSVDISKAQEELGFRPVYNLETGMAETVAWYKEQDWL